MNEHNDNKYLIINWKFIPDTNLSILFYYTLVLVTYEDFVKNKYIN